MRSGHPSARPCTRPCKRRWSAPRTWLRRRPRLPPTPRARRRAARAVNPPALAPPTNRPGNPFGNAPERGRGPFQTRVGGPTASTSGKGGLDGMSVSSAGNRGEQAERPRDIPLRGWKQVLLRVKDEIGKDNLSIVAAGVAFYGLFAIFPAITAFVTLYGLITDPAEVEQQLATLRGVMPEDAFGIVQQQMHSVVSQAAGSLSLGLLLSLALAVWSATKGTNAIFTALNIAYGEHEERGFLSLNLWSLAFTSAAS